MVNLPTKVCPFCGLVVFEPHECEEEKEARRQAEIDEAWERYEQENEERNDRAD